MLSGSKENTLKDLTFERATNLATLLYFNVDKMKWIGLSKMTFHPSSPHYLRKLCASGNIKEHISPFVPRSGHISFHLCPHHDHPLLPYPRRGFAARQEGGEDARMFLWRDCVEVREEGICGLSGGEGGGAVFGDREACGGSCGIRLSAAGA